MDLLDCAVSVATENKVQRVITEEIPNISYIFHVIKTNKISNNICQKTYKCFQDCNIYKL